LPLLGFVRLTARTYHARHGRAHRRGCRRACGPRARGHDTHSPADDRKLSRARCRGGIHWAARPRRSKHYSQAPSRPGPSARCPRSLRRTRAGSHGHTAGKKPGETAPGTGKPILKVNKDRRSPAIPPILKVQLSGEPLQTSPLELLTHSRLCYKRSMARWQRGRRRRGKLSGEGGSTQQPQQAIQPVYPDMVGEPESAPSEPPVAGVDASSTSQAQQQSGGRRRRRGRRGGRGGSAKRGGAVRSTQDQAAATAQGTAGSAEETVHRGHQQGRDREAARRAGQQLPPLAPEYPPERYQQPFADVSPDLPAARPQPGPQRKPRGVVVLTIGLPGSGKSSWFKRRGVTPLSSDLLRTLLFDNITEQRYQDLVFSTL